MELRLFNVRSGELGYMEWDKPFRPVRGDRLESQGSVYEIMTITFMADGETHVKLSSEINESPSGMGW